MNFTLSADHEALRDAAAKFLDKEASFGTLLVPGSTVLNSTYETLWPQVADLGWPAMVVPETFGGLGMSYIDLAMVIGETGRTLASCPLFGTLAGAWAIEKAGSEEQKHNLLGAVGAGCMKLALAIADSNGLSTNSWSDAAATGDGTNFTISGTKSFVVDAASSDRIVVAADANGQRLFFVVDRNAPGLTVDILPWRDVTRQVCHLTLDSVSAELLTQSDADTWPWIRDRLYMVLATESAAGIAAVLADAVSYAKERVAFGRPIGAFQAIKHQLAEIAGQSECATAAAHYAAWALSENDPKASLAAAMAQAYASEAYKAAAHRNIQVFGAIGFTWEMKNHLYYKRARANSELLGSPSAQREEVVRILEREAA